MAQNLCGTSVGREITSKLKSSLTVGNERSSECVYIHVDGRRLKTKHKLRSRHVVYGATIYDVSYNLEIDEDLTQPNPDGIKICVDSPVGNLCIKLSDIIAIIGVIAKADEVLATELVGIKSVLP